MKILHTSILLLWVIAETYACDMSDTSVVYFKLFKTQTYLPVSKKDFYGGRMVVKNAYFKKLLDQSKLDTHKVFFENIRMTVNFNNKIYYINDLGDIELENLVIGNLDKKTRDHLDTGNDLYEWETCRPFNEVLAEMLQKHKEHLDQLHKDQNHKVGINGGQPRLIDK